MTKVIDVDKIPVAHELMCYNPKEKANTWHVVVNHDSKGYVDRVQCKVTGVIRKYKKQNVVKSPAAAAKAIRKTAPGETDANGVRKPLTFKVSRARSSRRILVQRGKSLERQRSFSLFTRNSIQSGRRS